MTSGENGSISIPLDFLIESTYLAAGSADGKTPSGC
jgi:hypothetical protein